jgi:uncharacterized protein
LSDKGAYELTCTLHLNEKAFAAVPPQARETTAANTAKAAHRPELLHPSTLKYLKEIGLIK